MRAASSSTAQASLELRPGTVAGFGKALGMRAHGSVTGGAGAGEPTVGRASRTQEPWTHDEKSGLPAGASITNSGVVRGDTVHFDIVDRAGNMVSATPSGGWLQSSPVIPELGFCLGTRAQMFWLEDGHPAALAPGKRPRTTLTPTMALRDGEPYLAWGTPGGDQQDQWTTQLLLRHAHAGMNLQQAIDAPAWHSEHFPSSFWPREARPGVLVVEGRMPKETVKELRAPRPHRRGRRRLDRGPPHRRLPRRPPPPRRRQSARHAGVCGGEVRGFIVAGLDTTSFPRNVGTANLARGCNSLTFWSADSVHFASDWVPPSRDERDA